MVIVQIVAQLSSVIAVYITIRSVFGTREIARSFDLLFSYFSFFFFFFFLQFSIAFKTYYNVVYFAR